MNKYTKLSDFEINKAVFHKAKIKYKYFRFLPSGVITYNIKGKYQVFDPCNNPSDAMPILLRIRYAPHLMYLQKNTTAVIGLLHLRMVLQMKEQEVITYIVLLWNYSY